MEMIPSLIIIVALIFFAYVFFGPQDDYVYYRESSIIYTYPNKNKMETSKTAKEISLEASLETERELKECEQANMTTLLMWLRDEHDGWPLSGKAWEIRKIIEGRLCLQIQESAKNKIVAAQAKFTLGNKVRKTKGSQWTGTVVGTYSTTLTPEGYAVESSTELGSVQIYPAAALELIV